MKLWGLRKAAPTAQDSWWAEANAAADDPTREKLAALRASVPRTADPDDGERAEEVLDGLERLITLRDSDALPVLTTQHRVIGADVCHFSAPANYRDDADVPGRVFATSRRLLFAGPQLHAWPWHRIRRLVRVDRTVAVIVAGDASPVLVFNNYGDAMMLIALAARLRG